MTFVVDRKVTIGFTLAVLALGSLIVLSIYNTKSFAETTRIIVEQNNILYHAEEVKKHLLDVETRQRGYIITGDSLFLRPYEEGVLSVDVTLSRLSRLLEPTLANESRIATLRRLIAQKHAFSDSAIVARNKDFSLSQKIVASYHGTQLMDDIKDVAADIQKNARDVSDLAYARREQVVKQSNIILILVVATCLAVLCTVFLILNRTLGSQRKVETQVRELNSELEAFTYSVSHDLRSPLRVIDGYATILQEDYDEKLDNHGREVTATITRNVRKMSQLINDLLEFSHVSRKDISPALCSFDTMTDRVIAELTKTGNYSETRFKIDKLHPARADVRMIEQVWLNLISNALKYSSKTKQPLIEIGSYREDDEVCYYVKDNGVGFDIKYKDKLFGVFQRLHRPEDFPGTGVGLAIVKRIVGRHGGRVWAESSPVDGTTFHFSLPNR